MATGSWQQKFPLSWRSVGRENRGTAIAVARVAALVAAIVFLVGYLTADVGGRVATPAAPAVLKPVTDPAPSTPASLQLRDVAIPGALRPSNTGKSRSSSSSEQSAPQSSDPVQPSQQQPQPTPSKPSGPKGFDSVG